MVCSGREAAGRRSRTRGFPYSPTRMFPKSSSPGICRKSSSLPWRGDWSFGYLDESGNQLGFDIDVARYLAKALFDDTGERLELVPVTSGSRISFLYSRWIDVIIASMTITEDRKRVLNLSHPYLLSGSMILAPRESSINGNSRHCSSREE
jgi:hypothetical protein